MRTLYRRIVPHLERVRADLGIPPDNIQDLLLLQRNNEELKDYIKVAFCPELYGSKIRTSGINNFITKGYSANSIQREIGDELVTNGTFDTNTNWNAGLDGALTISNGVATINNNGSGRCRFGQLLSTISGKKYRVIFTINRVDRSISFITSSYSKLIAETKYIAYDSIGIKSYDFIATTSNTYIGFLDDNLSDINATTILDNVSIREVLSNDLTQTSSTNQPYLDKVSPNERLSAKNPNGDDCYLTHRTVSFSATDEWTVETTLNWNGRRNLNDDVSIAGGGYRTRIAIDYGTHKNFLISSDNDSYYQFTADKKIGKAFTLSVVYDTVNVKTYINGVLVNTTTKNSSFVFQRLLSGWTGQIDSTYSAIYSHHIFSKALSANQIAERASILHSIFPEIPFTRIGEQIWSVRNYEAVVTPQGTLIPEMQANANVEKITNVADREFTSDTLFWSRDTGVTIADGVCHFTNAANSRSLVRTLYSSTAKYAKITFTILNYVSGRIRILSGGEISQTFNANGTYTIYLLAGANGAIYFQSNIDGTTLDLDNVSVQEIGWGGSQELYDGIYAQTSGTVEQKTYAAVKAAAMWCHYNNDVNLGATYGKLYNWFAVKLIQMDIDKYNTDNPTTPWGWRVPTQVDFNTLATTLGGTSVAGGKMKMQGTTYWNSPNTGASNVSGFSAIGNGHRHEHGGFTGNIKLSSYIWCIMGNIELNYTWNYLSMATYSNQLGGSLRLIKS